MLQDDELNLGRIMHVVLALVLFVMGYGLLAHIMPEGFILMVPLAVLGFMQEIELFRQRRSARRLDREFRKLTDPLRPDPRSTRL